MRRGECHKVSFGELGCVYKFRAIADHSLTWSWSCDEIRSVARVRKYYIWAYKERGKEIMVKASVYE